MVLAASIFAFLVTFTLPIGGRFAIVTKNGRYLKPLLSGVYAYIGLQLTALLPFIQTLSDDLSSLGPTLSAYAAACIMAVLAEGIRAVSAHYTLGKSEISQGDCLASGFGSWALEAVLTTGLAAISIVTNYTALAPTIDGTVMLLSGLERMAVLPITVLFAYLTVMSYKNRSPLMFALSCVLRAGLNGTLSVVQTSGINSSVIIGGLWVVALAACAAMWKILKPKGLFKKTK